MPKVAFAGAYGIRSQGDDAALQVMVDGLRERLGGFEGVVISRHAQEDHDFGLLEEAIRSLLAEAPDVPQSLEER